MLQLPVPAFEPFVRARYEHYDSDYVSADPGFVHAHVTVLGPWLTDPSAGELEAVRDIAASTPAFTVRMDEVELAHGGMICLRPKPVAPCATLTGRLITAFPGCVPYQGRYATAPHLTLDQRSSGVGVGSVRAMLGSVLPLTAVMDRLDVAWYEPGACRVLASFPLG